MVLLLFYLKIKPNKDKKKPNKDKKKSNNEFLTGW